MDLGVTPNSFPFKFTFPLPPVNGEPSNSTTFFFCRYTPIIQKLIFIHQLFKDWPPKRSGVHFPDTANLSVTTKPNPI